MRRKANETQSLVSKGCLARTRGDYQLALEAYHGDLILNQKAGRISDATHEMLETFLTELQSLVKEHTGRRIAKAA